MEFSEKPTWNKFTREELKQLVIHEPDRLVGRKVITNWDTVAKPIDGMGRFETLTAQIGAIIGSDRIDISKKAVIVMCADNGIVEENISQSGQEVTIAVAKAMANNQASVCRMARSVGVDTIPVDIGINQREPIQGVLDQKIRCGTRNFRKEPAMTEEEAIRAIAVGIDMVFMCREAGYHILATGELGVGNTTTSSAVAAALLKCDAHEVTGRGAGLNDEGLFRKRQVITEAVEKYNLQNTDALTILTTVGGLDIAGLVGICIGGAIFHVPIVLDGLISMVAALLAQRIAPGTREYFLPSHKGKEPAVERLMKELEIEPVIDGKMALGEGTGAVMMLSLLDMALSIYHDRTTFSDIKIDQYERYETK